MQNKQKQEAKVPAKPKEAKAKEVKRKPKVGHNCKGLLEKAERWLDFV